MAKHRVQQWGKPNGFVTVETDATVGAVLGVNVFWPDGSLVEYAQLELYPPGTPEAEANGQPPPGEEPGPGESQPPGDGTVYWRTIMEIPPNVTALAGLSGTGVVRRTGDSTFDVAATTSDVPEGTNLYYTDTRADARAAAAVGAHESAPNPHPQYVQAASLASLPNAIDDAAAAIAGVSVGGQYRNGSVLMVRIS